LFEVTLQLKPWHHIHNILNHPTETSCKSEDSIGHFGIAELWKACGVSDRKQCFAIITLKFVVGITLNIFDFNIHYIAHR
jgi:hypothetical protein